jgi:hypothetical protein
VAVVDSKVTSDEAAPIAVAVVDSVTSGEAAPSAVAVVDSVTSGEAAPSAVAVAVVDSVTSGEAAPSAVAVAVVDSSVTSDEAALTAKRHSKQDAIDALFGQSVVRAPGTPETSAVIATTSTPVKKLKQTKIGAFIEDQRPVAATVDISAPSGDTAPDAAVDDITELIFQALVERRRLRAKPIGPPTAEEQAVYEDTLRGVSFHADETDYAETFTGCKVTVVSTVVTSGNADAGSLVLSRRRPDADEGLWVLDLVLFRESHP